MKKIISFFTLLFLFIAGFMHYPTMTFAIGHNVTEKNDVNINFCSTKNHNNKSINPCCEESTNSYGFIYGNFNLEKKISNFIIINKFIDYFSYNSKYTNIYKLNKKTSPPIYNRVIKNYSYSNFIKIIKSNI